MLRRWSSWGTKSPPMNLKGPLPQEPSEDGPLDRCPQTSPPAACERGQRAGQLEPAQRGPGVFLGGAMTAPFLGCRSVERGQGNTEAE